ncbi:MAG TPA: PDZ domain-containing protein [Longimicrobium sp.]
MKATVLTATAAILLAAPAFGQAPAPKAQQEVVRAPASRRPPATLGLALRARPGRSADGRMQWADFPVVREVWAGMPAARVGILPGDLIISANGVDGRELKAMLPTHVGQRFALRIRRGDEVRDYTLVTVPNPPDR